MATGLGIVAIDFGTSNTVVAVQVGKDVTIWQFAELTREFDTNQGRVAVVPSLAYKQVSGWLWGEQVRALTAQQKRSNRYWHCFKRELVASIQTPDRYLDDSVWHSALVAELFLQELLDRLGKAGIQPEQLIFTAPVGAFNSYLQWFRRFTKHLFAEHPADAPLVLLVDESTAAALGYAIAQPNLLIMVIDFGGGTLDISVVRTIELMTEQQAFQAEVVAKASAYIGGVDIDEWIAEYWLAKEGLGRSSIDQQTWIELLARAEQAKINPNTNQEYSLSRQELTAILEERSFLEQLRTTLDEALEIALQKGITKSAIAQVLLVGGSCLLTPVQELVCAYFGSRKVQLEQPFTAVARGALVLGTQAGVKDYLHHSYGIRLWDGFARQYQFYTLFAKGTQYPAQLAEPLILQVATEAQPLVTLDIGEVGATAQTEISYDKNGKITAVQLQKVSDFQNLQSLTIDLIPCGELGKDRLQVNFCLNHDRTLLVTVVDLLTNQALMADHPLYKLS